MLTLVMLASLQAHQFTGHFRAPEVRHSVERHAVLIESRTDTSNKLAVAQRRLSQLLWTDPENITKLQGRFGSISMHVPRVMRLLLRLKLGASTRGSTDPLV